MLQIYTPIALPPVSYEEKLNLYKDIHQESITNPNKFWGDKAKELLHWFSPFSTVCNGDFLSGDINWFANGKTNACYNCIDRHLESRANQVSFFLKIYIYFQISGRITTY